MKTVDPHLMSEPTQTDGTVRSVEDTKRHCRASMILIDCPNFKMGAVPGVWIIWIFGMAYAHQDEGTLDSPNILILLADGEPAAQFLIAAYECSW